MRERILKLLKDSARHFDMPDHIVAHAMDCDRTFTVSRTKFNPKTVLNKLETDQIKRESMRADEFIMTAGGLRCRLTC